MKLMEQLPRRPLTLDSLKALPSSALLPRRQLTRESVKAPPYVGLRRICPDCSAVTKISFFCDECFEWF